MPGSVLDAWAIMAWLKDQKPAAERVRALLDAADHRQHKLFMNIVNLGEVFYLSVKAKNLTYGEQVLNTLRPRILTVSASDELVMLAAGIKARHAISYADAFAAATAMLWDAPLVTGDRDLQTMFTAEKTFKLECIAD